MTICIVWLKKNVYHLKSFISYYVLIFFLSFDLIHGTDAGRKFALKTTENMEESEHDAEHIHFK